MGSLICTIGNFVVPTLFCGTVYNLDYVILSEKQLPSKLLIGNPLVSEARVVLNKKGPIIEPLIGDSYVVQATEEVRDSNNFSDIVKRVDELY